MEGGVIRHMTGNRSFFSELKECASRHVTFGDDPKGRIIAKRLIIATIGYPTILLFITKSKKIRLGYGIENWDMSV
ncbi:uncharacterized protein E5676_scaffold232G00350 [Cucumis melo var. makuwa]|uniref:Uncharacterized protein n=1 Tax=Cucumis melo var. makuwa TaxID=1194695 RepID=A0A5D3BH08_CUCMM|nr:uncharacterized protein E5676_scaffold232G00350 [Cucumis melo var. makuwa]